MSDNPKAYEGKEPYIFVSYCHKDSERVFPFILALQERYNVWYDEGIYFGEAWDEEIVRKLDACAGVLFMVTEQSLKSKYCEKELKYAEQESKDIISIHMDDGLALPKWYKFHFVNINYFKLHGSSSLEDEVADLSRKSTWLKCIEKKPSQPDKKPVQKPNPKSAKSVVLPTANKVQETTDEAFEFLYARVKEPVQEPEAKSVKPVASPVVQQIRKTPEEIIKSLKGILEFRRFRDVIILTKGIEGLKTVEIPFFVRTIGAEAFVGSRLEYVVIPDSVETIAVYAFANCRNLSNVTLGRGLKRIMTGAFKRCYNLRSIIVHEGVIEISEEAFYFSGLTEIILPASLKTIGKEAFRGTMLQRVNYRGSRKQWEKIDFADGNHELLTAQITYNYTAP